jgi:hypothetical protein
MVRIDRFERLSESAIRLSIEWKLIDRLLQERVNPTLQSGQPEAASSSGLDEVVVERRAHCWGTRIHVQIGEDIGDMRAGVPTTDKERLANVAVALAFGQ